ncbi:toxin biosynthesis protein [Exophiala viscosa]|uniref:toxin biosynthesis protein n=1 Tax=Exophiala viscosa TaxID=2486360 RepID=UPI00218E990E|nr:toxin biosynthesis protein [Exophiala viscosa]
MGDFRPTWTVKEHVIPASHPRGYRRGVRDPQTSRLRLHVKQYIPATPRPLADDGYAVTLIVQHGMPPGDNKEACEPFMWDLLCQPNLPPVRSIWAMDIASAGQSFLLNRKEIGDEPHWFDSSRDLLQVINHFQAEMRPPLIGFGQSWGGSVIAMCAAWHPRLFEGVIMSEPVTENGYYHALEASQNGDLAHPAVRQPIGFMVGRRKRHYPSRAALNESVGRNEMWKPYDKRVLQQMLRYDYQDLDDGRVELITPPNLTLHHFQQPSPPLRGYPEHEDYATRPAEANHPPGFYKTVQIRVKEALADVTCKILFLWGSKGGYISSESYRKRLIDAAQAKGSRPGQIQQKFVPGGHSLIFIVPTETAEASVGWIEQIWKDWNEEEGRRRLDAPIDPENVPGEVIERMQKVSRVTKL